MKNNQTNKRNVIDWVLIFLFIFLRFISDNQLYRNYALLAVAVLGILISLGILIFKKDLAKTGKIRELIAIGLLVIAVGYAVFRIITLSA
ncbi:MAG: hypothetical protein PHV04_04995 [Clostridia bacterium]|nr:hypothetical protein [Clostridia bacterium]HXK71597.1 hypothetical protein [Clostridia bacterium]